MILAFKERFNTKILDGSKIHTIRKDEQNRWGKGNTIHFANNVRTNGYKQFHKGVCKSVQVIEMIFTYPSDEDLSAGIDDIEYDIYIDGRALTYTAIRLLAQNDGFDETEDFLEFFDDDFKGVIIHWTDFRY